MIELLLANWQIIAAAIIIIIAAAWAFIRFSKKSTDGQIAQVKEWLLYAVVKAEKELGSGTGMIKLRYVYDMFLAKFPLLIAIVPFTTFSELVDEALDKMKDLLATSPELKTYVENISIAPVGECGETYETVAEEVEEA